MQGCVFEGGAGRGSRLHMFRRRQHRHGSARYKQVNAAARAVPRGGGGCDLQGWFCWHACQLWGGTAGLAEGAAAVIVQHLVRLYNAASAAAAGCRLVEGVSRTWLCRRQHRLSESNRQGHHHRYG
jgi:hypothetical protein